MPFYGYLSCPLCGNRHLRREFAPGPNWTSYKCLEDNCKAVFAIYDNPPEPTDKHQHLQAVA